MSRSLFEEAIADAKQLREVAEQNAKKAIVEAVTPRIKEFIEQQLTNESNDFAADDDFIFSSLNEESDEDVIIPPSKAKHVMEDDDVVELNESALTALIDLVANRNNGKESEMDALKEAFEMLSSNEKQALLNLAKNPESHTSGAVKTEAVSNAQNKMSKETSGVNKMNKNTAEMFELDLDDLNEDKITIDFGKDITLDAENPYTVIVGPSDEEEEDVTLEEPPAEEEVITPEPGAEEEGEAAPDEAADEGMVFEIDENLLRDAIASLREAKKATKETKMKNMPGPKAAAKAFGGGDLKDMDEVVLNKFAKLKESYENEVRKNRALQQQLNEYRNGIETLREQLSELNLFNAKLLYVNKLTSDREITSSQRRAVVEALDGAKNLREAKLLYKSMSESLDRRNPAQINESAHRLSPGNASRPITSGGATNLNEGTALDRWATLAGLR